MSDAKLQLTWENRGKFSKENITPIVLKPVKSNSLKADLSWGNMIIEGNNLDVVAALLTGGFGLQGRSSQVVEPASVKYLSIICRPHFFRKLVSFPTVIEEYNLESIDS
ncbi:MAG: hypothetical protein M3R15_14780 [Acidobacteriota bacterium]|nr:hypothetical protein [Acidobacteriota bacterium]